jgi:flagellar motor switch protein FliM
MINLCIPYNAIERLGNKLSATSWVSYGKTQSNPDSRRMIERNLSGSLVEVVVQLAKTRITTKELIGLRIGDIITTEHDVKQPLLVEIESIPKFTARPGALKSHKAIQIEEQIVPDKPGDPSRV